MHAVTYVYVHDASAGLAARCLQLSCLEHLEARRVDRGASVRHGQEEVLDGGSLRALVRVRTRWPYPLLVVCGGALNAGDQHPRT